MRQTSRFLGVAAVAVGIRFLVPTVMADSPRVSRSGLRWSGGYSGGYHSGYYGGFRNRYWGCGGWYPWNFSFSYVYSPPPYYYYGYYYPRAVYYAPPAVYSSVSAEVYDSPPAVYSSGSAEIYDSPPPAPAVENSKQPAIDHPLSPTAADKDSPPVASQGDQKPRQIQRSYQGQSLGLADVKALVKAGLSEEVILSQIRNSHAVYRLTAAEIIDLKESGVSEKIIDFMINTALRPAPRR